MRKTPLKATVANVRRGLEAAGFARAEQGPILWHSGFRTRLMGSAEKGNLELLVWHEERAESSHERVRNIPIRKAQERLYHVVLGKLFDVKYEKHGHTGDEVLIITEKTLAK